MSISKKFEDWFTAGQIVAEVLRVTKKLKPGVYLLRICEELEKMIIKKGAKPAFPVNISINEIAAHYAGLPGDKMKIPEIGLVKLDVGAHVNGAIADAAITIGVGGLPPKIQSLLKATESVLIEAISVIKDGIRVNEISNIVWKKAHEFGFGVLVDLGGHSIERWKLHAGIFIPNKPVKGKGVKLHKGQILAIEPFLVATSRDGSTIPVWEKTHIFAINEKKKSRDTFLKVIYRKFNYLPFAARWIVKNQKEYNKLLQRFSMYSKQGLIHFYPPLIEARGAWVAQFEHTVLVKENSAEILTTVN
ncbi:MAG: type II methionyl aminopeptidase [Candidatus Njordarchaeales archaeon]